MRIDVVTIFPDYLRPLELSLPGRAQAAGLLDVRVHDLRRWTTDRHRTVDDTPYGGGAGMVMRPEPWGAALDALIETGQDTVLVVPTPSGEPFTQGVATELAGAQRLVVACGRYEGIDQRVLDDASARVQVRTVSLGDYVVNGGEVAALAVIEAVVRLLPGFLGNPESLAEESHGPSRLLEYPVYTKPPSWRGHDVPPVLLSGDHARIAAWRQEQAVRRTAQRRPDLLHPSRALTVGTGAGPGGIDVVVRTATAGDAGELLTLQLACWVAEAQANGSLDIPPLRESLADVQAWLPRWTTFVVRSSGRLVAAVRGQLHEDVWDIGRLMVAPDLRGRGLGRWLLGHVESAAPPEARRLSLFTGARSADNLRWYRRAGYRPVPETGASLAQGTVHLTKTARRHG
ncbi:MAG TPA: tRNA (guanosine(37)-N1)-methyltransferase TrmD [Nocardioidaceae bacterium]|nr:tRNA (guanosine(37)-N1)-methyltransferase TrmD [Nocardioidaceae bacterium]